MVEVWTLNYNRTLGLLKKSIKLVENIEDKIEFVKYFQDILRASVVLLHSSSETLLREIIRKKLKYDGDLSKLSFYDGLGHINKKDRISMRDLQKYRGKTIDEIIELSIDNYLNTISFNSSNDIFDALNQVGIDSGAIKEQIINMNEMIIRRHRIVHEADIPSGLREPRNMDVNDVTKWLKNSSIFFEGLMEIVKKNIYYPIIKDRALKENIISTPDTDISTLVNIEIALKEYY